MNTKKFYDKNSPNLIEKYNQANMDNLHKLFDKYILNKSKILDIGFGSNRDLKYLHEKGHDIWGVDPTIEFIKNAQKNFKNKSSNFFTDSLPSLSNTLNFKIKFDALICIAVIMHLKDTEYEESISNIIKLLNDKAIIIFSYSIGIRKEKDERDFYDVNKELLFNLFKKYNLNLIYKDVNIDSLNRDELIWETLVLEYQLSD